MNEDNRLKFGIILMRLESAGIKEMCIKYHIYRTSIIIEDQIKYSNQTEIILPIVQNLKSKITIE